MKTDLRRTTIFLTKEQHEKLRDLAFVKRTSMSKLLRDATCEILEDEEDVREGLKSYYDKEGTITLKEYLKKTQEIKTNSEIQS